MDVARQPATDAAAAAANSVGQANH